MKLNAATSAQQIVDHNFAAHILALSSAELPSETQRNLIKQLLVTASCAVTSLSQSVATCRPALLCNTRWVLTLPTRRQMPGYI